MGEVMNPGYEMNLKMSRNDLVAILQRMDRTLVAAENIAQEDIAEDLRVVIVQAIAEFDYALDLV
jgi:hypothetical protein